MLVVITDGQHVDSRTVIVRLTQELNPYEIIITSAGSLCFPNEGIYCPVGIYDFTKTSGGINGVVGGRIYLDILAIGGCCGLYGPGCVGSIRNLPEVVLEP